MTIQDVALTIALSGMAIVACSILYVVSQASRPADEAAAAHSAHTAHAVRRWLFFSLVVVFVVGTWVTLRPYPIPEQHAPTGAHQVVSVEGRQWTWLIKPATVYTGSAVEFDVTSTDVNHGFAIYGPDGRIVTQTQAMPGYTNRIVHTFDQPGRYQVMCLEYCGLGHAPMTAYFTVTAPPPVSGS